MCPKAMSPAPDRNAPRWVLARWLVNHSASTFRELGVTVDDAFLHDLGADAINAFQGHGELSPVKVLALVQYARILENKAEQEEEV